MEAGRSGEGALWCNGADDSVVGEEQLGEREMEVMYLCRRFAG